MRYRKGVTTIQHKGKSVTTNVGTSFDDIVASADDKQYRKARLNHLHEGRPDVISDLFYDTPDNWWFIMHINNINDPLQQLTSGRTFKIPNV